MREQGALCYIHQRGLDGRFAMPILPGLPAGWQAAPGRAGDQSSKSRTACLRRSAAHSSTFRGLEGWLEARDAIKRPPPPLSQALRKCDIAWW
jgi:hypothetical protein